MKFLLNIFPSRSDIFLLQNHPFQAFLVSKTFIFAHKLRHVGGGAKGLSGHVR